MLEKLILAKKLSKENTDDEDPCIEREKIQEEIEGYSPDDNEIEELYYNKKELLNK